jgi:phosphoserine / homoserine phosphotransferase
MLKAICCDLEGVFVPEVWINVAKKTGIEELKLTTRDITDYNVLMQKRLGILEKHGLTLKYIQDVIDTLDPLKGAKEFLNELKDITNVFVVSDTFVEFADPLMRKLGRPTLFCNYLTVDHRGMVTDYHLRQPDQKREVVKALQALRYEIIAFGDSYNDISMLQQAEHGILYCPPDNVVADYPEFPVTRNYGDLKAEILKHM